MAPGPAPPTYGYGYQYPQHPAAAPSTAPNPVCLASTVLAGAALFSFFCCFIVGVPFGLAAIITGIIGLNQTRGQPVGTDRTLAIIGLCGGAGSLALPLLGLLFFTLPTIGT